MENRNRLGQRKLSIEILPMMVLIKKHLSTFIQLVDKLILFVNALVLPINDFQKFTINNDIISRINRKAFESLQNTDIPNWQRMIHCKVNILFIKPMPLFLNKYDLYELFSIINEKAKEFNGLIRN